MDVVTTRTTAQVLHEHWGASVRRARAGRTQSWLAARVGVDQSTISRIERGSYRMNADLLVALAAALDVEVEVLFAFPPGLLRRGRTRRTGRES
jgi:DNA-binding XRE family transcriptional regulator